MKKKLSVIISLALSFTQLFTAYAVTQTDPLPTETKNSANELALDAQSAILMDAATGEIIFEKNIDEKQYPASITKLMTVLLAMEYGKFDEPIIFSNDAVFSIEPGSSHIAIDVNEQITLEQSLYAIMLQSANEVSNGVGEHIAGSMDAFAALMTKRAKELGCTGTNFVNANGLHNENHYTTAHDMALIGKELIKYDFFKKLMSTTYYEIPPTNKQPETRYLYGQNQLIKKSSIFYYEGCEGGKTGFTNEAGNTLVAFAKKGNTELISVVLKSTGYGEYTDTAALFNYGFDNFETIAFAKKGDSPSTINVIETQKRKTLDLGTLNAVYSDDVMLTVPKGTNITLIKPTYKIADSYEAPVNAGDIISDVLFSIDNTEVGCGKLIAEKTILPSYMQPDDGSRKKPISLTLVISLFLVAVILLALIKLTMNKIEYNRRKKKRIQRIEKYKALRKNSEEK